MTMADLSSIYRAYIDCLNRQDWGRLGDFVAEDVRYNNETIGLAGYRAMLEQDFDAIPDLHFGVALLVADEHNVASRLDFTCSPRGVFLGLPVNGQTVSFSENVFYRFDSSKIVEVWSVLDKVAIERQLAPQ